MAVITIADIRSIGITPAMADDTAVTAAIAESESVFNTQCRQFFEPMDGAMELDGDNTTSFFLDIPIISITSIVDNLYSQTIPATDYRVYNGRTMIQDDRGNPMIVGVNGQRWGEYPQRWAITGTFGYVEADGVSAPAQVRKALIIMISDSLLNPIIDVGAVPPAEINDDLLPQGGQTEEATDDHRIKWAVATAISPWDPYSSISKYPFVTRTIKNFRAPIGISTQSGFSSFVPSTGGALFPVT